MGTSENCYVFELLVDASHRTQPRSSVQESSLQGTKCLHNIVLDFQENCLTLFIKIPLSPHKRTKMIAVIYQSLFQTIHRVGY